MKYRSFFALILVVLLLLSGCGTVEKSETTEEAPVGSVAGVIDADDQMTFVDFCRAEDGYAVLTVKNSGPVVSYRDAALNETDQTDLGLGEAFAITMGGGHCWVAAMGEGSKISVLCDNSNWLDTDISGYLYQSQLAWEDGVLYTVLNRSLWIGQTKVELPESASGTRYQVWCVARIGDQMYALVTAMSGSEAAGQWLCPIDASTTRLELPDHSFPVRAESAVWDGGTTWMLCDSVLYRTDGIACDSVCDLSASGVEAKELLRILPGDNGTFYALQKKDILHVDPNAAQEAKALIMGVYTLFTDCDPAIAAFNRAGTGWRIRAKYFNDIETMNLAILNGELDLVCSFDENIMHNFAAKGLLAPIDSSLTVQVLPNVVKACSERDNCWYLPRGIQLSCAKIPISYVKDPNDLKDLDCLIDVINNNCRFVYGCFEKEGILTQIIQNCGDGWVDWDNRTADFMSHSFLSVLEFSNQFEDTREATMANRTNAERGDKGLLLLDYQIRLDYYTRKRSSDPVTGEEGWYFFPFPVGNCSGFSMRQNGFYAAVQGKNTTGSNAFFQFLFSDDFWFDKPEDMTGNIYDLQYPVNAVHCEELLNMQLDACFNNPYCDTTGLKEASVEWLEEIKRADHFCYSWSNEINDIILEEAKPYFNGDISAEETARRIQNRVEIYLAERG